MTIRNYNEGENAAAVRDGWERTFGRKKAKPSAAPDRVIKRNRCRCRRCGDVIESKHRHDFVACMCGAIHADGGRDYLKRGGDLSAVVELTEYEDG
jgi:hypothetical protein